MSKPSDELLRRAREHWCPDGSDDKERPLTDADVLTNLAVFAEQIVRECAEIANEQDVIDCDECHGCGTVVAFKIRQQFGLKE